MKKKNIKHIFLLLAIVLSFNWTATAQDFEWVKGMGGTDFDIGYSITTDASGNVYTVGVFNPAVDFDPNAGIAYSIGPGLGSQIFIQKLSPAGNLIWVRTIGGSFDDSGQSITIDNNGDLVITGAFFGTVDFDTGLGVANLTAVVSPIFQFTDFNPFVLKMDQNGNYIWAKSIEGRGNATNVSTDNLSNIYISGFFSETVDFNPDPSISNTLSGPNYVNEAFVLKLDNNGTFNWVKKIGDSPGGNSVARDISVSDFGQVSVVGSFSGTMNFTTTSGTISSLTSNGVSDIFILTLDLSGNYAWSRSMGSTSADRARGVITDDLGNVYTTGTFRKTVNFNPSGGVFNLTNTGAEGSFLQKLDASGNFLFAKNLTESISSGSAGSGYAITLNALDEIYISGYFNGTVDLDPGPGVVSKTSISNSFIDAFVTKLNSSGDFEWSNRMSNGNTTSFGITVSNTNNVYTTGQFDNTTNFNADGPSAYLNTHGGLDIFIHKISPSQPVIATQPNLSLCCSDGPINLGTEYIPTGNVYHTFGYFTPEDGYPGGIGPAIGGEFIDLPACVTTQDFPGGFRLYSIDPCTCPPGVYPITYAYTDNISGITSSATMTITINDSPTISFPTLTVDLCDYSGPIPINPLTTGINCTASGPFVVSNQFDAASAGVGTHNIEITCESASGNGCTTTITGTIIVEEKDAWHNTTSKAIAFELQGDVGNDIYTDDDGYVYSTGSFRKETVFEDLFGNTIILTSISAKEETFYAVCYNQCGELQWVVYDEFQAFNHHSSGFGISKNEDEIFIGVNYNPKALFTTIYPSGTTSSFSLNASGASGINDRNICVLAVDGPSVSTFGEVNAIHDNFNQTTGTALYTVPSGPQNIFLCGRSDDDGDLIPKVFYAQLKYNTVSNLFNTAWARQSLDQSPNHIANDITLNLSNNQILLTGTFSDELSLRDTPGSTVAIFTPGIKDAFITAINSSGYVDGFGVRAFGIEPGEESEGTSITSYDDYFYVGGNYRGVTGSPFGLGAPPTASFSNSTFQNSFIFSYRWSTNTAKIESIWNTNSRVKITGIDAREANVAFVGHSLNGIVETSTGGITSNPSVSENQVFIGKIDLLAGNWFTPKIVNSTLNFNLGDHISTRVSIGIDNYAFLTGTYNGRLSYFTGLPSSGDLNSSGINPLVYNAFFLRHELNTGALRKPSQIDDFSVNENTIDHLENELNISAYPNPTSGLLNVKIESDFDENLIDIELYNAIGKLVYSTKVENSTFEIELSSFEKGIYILKATTSNTTGLLRVIKS